MDSYRLSVVGQFQPCSVIINSSLRKIINVLLRVYSLLAFTSFFFKFEVAGRDQKVMGSSDF